MPSQFFKYHALGNDYIVIDPAKCPLALTENAVKLICNRNFGVGADGILYGPFLSEDGAISLKIFNPDGSEAEKSGNGLRIFARYLVEAGYAQSKDFQVSTKGGRVSVHLDSPDGKLITISMGQLTFDSQRIPVRGPKREVILEPIEIGNQKYEISAASIGNPHCVIICDKVDKLLATSLGPLIECHSMFPNRTNVQFMKILDRNNIQIEIWERGVGYTLASGSSSCAAAGVAFKLGQCDSEIKVHMPGGVIDISISDDFSINMRGEVSSVCEGTFTAGFEELLGSQEHPNRARGQEGLAT
ncbi:MAG: diaminopimelate epimerase [Chloroflexota bacterium]